jgi:hypothetical protein
MGTTPQAGFSSTPAFEVFRRGLITQTIQRFHGINVYSTLTQLGPDWAQDTLNVVISGSGGLSKLRLPVKLTPAIGGQNGGPDSFWDFQQGNGTRQTLAVFGRSIYYYSNDLSLVTLIETSPLDAGAWSFTTSSQILWGMNSQRAQKWTGSNWWAWGIQAPANGVGVVPHVAGTLSPSNGGYFYWYAWKNSVTNSVGNISPASTVTGNIASVAFQPTATASPDPQVDTIVWFRSLDGGGDPFRLCEVKIATSVVTAPNSSTNVVVVGGPGSLQISDQTPDSGLDQATRGPLINNPPLLGKFVATAQNRVFIFNLIGNPQDVIYSGYEQILFGRPEECFPPNNRLRLSIGAEQIAGGGVLQAGVVTFSQTGRMYMLRGQVEDITLSQPVNFTQYLEELPWTLGCASHYTIQSTPYGLVWLAGDKTVQLFDGRSEPYDISAALYPYLRRITPGTEASAVSGYFNWLERDWYALMVAVDGSLVNNRLFLFAFNTPPGSDSPDSVEVFISDIPNLIGGGSWVGIVTTSKLQRMLCISAGGFIQQLPVSSDTVGGITLDYTINPPTNGNLNAYWRGGYFGNDSPQRSKTFRWMRLITDQAPRSFAATFRRVDDEQFPLTQPEIIGPVSLGTSRIGINKKGKRLSPEINFPALDAPANVLELQMASIGTADR